MRRVAVKRAYWSPEPTETDMKTFEYMSDTIRVHVSKKGKRFSWRWETGSGLKGELDESATETEDAAVLEAQYSARRAIDKKHRG